MLYLIIEVACDFMGKALEIYKIPTAAAVMIIIVIVGTTVVEMVAAEETTITHSAAGT